MKLSNWVTGLLIFLGCLAGAASPAAGQPAGVNYDQAALLKWPGFGQQTSFEVGAGPLAMAFDGENVWVAMIIAKTYSTYRYPPGSVTKLRASDGTNLGVFRMDGQPKGLVFDGTHIWVVNSQSPARQTLSKLRVSDGAILENFSLPAVDTDCETAAVAFDGTHIWVGGFYHLTRLRVSDGAMSSYEFAYGDITALAFDGTDIWAATSYRYGERDYACILSRLRVSDGAILQEIPFNRFSQISSLAFDGAHIWAADFNYDPRGRGL